MRAAFDSASTESLVSYLESSRSCSVISFLNNDKIYWSILPSFNSCFVFLACKRVWLSEAWGWTPIPSWWATSAFIDYKRSLARSVIYLKNSCYFISYPETPTFHTQTITMMLPMSIFCRIPSSFSPEPSSPASSNPSARTSFWLIWSGWLTL